MLPLSKPITEEPVSTTHTSFRSPVRSFGRGLLSNTTAAGNADVPRKWTHEDQDHSDERERKKAMNELVQSWMDRLQLISVIVSSLYGPMDAI